MYTCTVGREIRGWGRGGALVSMETPAHQHQSNLTPVSFYIISDYTVTVDSDIFSDDWNSAVIYSEIVCYLDWLLIQFGNCCVVDGRLNNNMVQCVTYHSPLPPQTRQIDIIDKYLKHSSWKVERRMWNLAGFGKKYFEGYVTNPM